MQRLVLVDLHREAFFTLVRARFALADSAVDLRAAYRRRMPYLVECRLLSLIALSSTSV